MINSVFDALADNRFTSFLPRKINEYADRHDINYWQHTFFAGVAITAFSSKVLMANMIVFQDPSDADFEPSAQQIISGCIGNLAGVYLVSSSLTALHILSRPEP